MTDGEEGTAKTWADILDLYSLTVEMADRVSERRASANTYFFTVQAGLAVSVGAFAVNAGTSARPERFPLFLAAFAGLVISCSWWLLLRSYRDLNKAKYAVITRIEKAHLPIQPFAEEWRALKDDPVESWRGRYAELGQVERAVPLVFAAIYLALSIYVVCQ